MKRLLLMAGLAGSALLGGCMTAGPDYAAPNPTPPAAFARREPIYSAGEAQAEWWRAFGDPVLDSLVAEAVNNSDVRLARSRLLEARALLRAAGAAEGPTGGATASYAYTRPFVQQFGLDVGTRPELDKSFDLYQSGLDASWELDLFGGRRRGVEAARARLGAAEAQLADVRVSVAAEVALAYLELRGLQARLGHIRQVGALDAKLVDLTHQRRDEGTASELEAGAVRNQRNMDLAEEPRLRGEVAVQMDRLAVLVGQRPGGLDDLLAPVSPVPSPPAALAVGDPAALLRRRPDVRTAERRLAASTAEIGVAAADLFPKVSLLGSGGFASLGAEGFGGSDTVIYSVGPKLSWAFLDLQRVRARIAQADARRQQAFTQYEMAVNGALGDAEAGLTRFARARETLAARRHSLASATGAAKLVDQRYAEGLASLRESLEAHRIETQQAERVSIAETELAKTYVVLSKSLGLAWSEAAPAQPGAGSAPD